MATCVSALVLVSFAIMALVAPYESGPHPQSSPHAHRTLLHSYGSLPPLRYSGLQQVPNPLDDPQRQRQFSLPQSPSPFNSPPSQDQFPSEQVPSPFAGLLPRGRFPSQQGTSPFGGLLPQGQFPSQQGLSAFSGPPSQGQFPAGFPPHGSPPFPKDLPPGFAEVLPSATVAQIRSIHQDQTLSWQQKHERIDAIMSSLPAEILDRLPTPPGFNMLPPDVQTKLKALHRESGLNWQERHMKIREIIESLTPEQRRLLPPSPPPPVFGQTFREISNAD